MRIMNEVSYLAPHMDEINSVTLDDPELFKYPVAYIIEVGWWTMTDRQAAALRAFMQKGGFVIVDDFKVRGWGGGMGGGGWDVFEANMRRVLPDVRFYDMQAIASDLPLVLRDRRPRYRAAGLQLRPADLPRRLRRQRSRASA